MNYLYNWSFC